MGSKTNNLNVDIFCALKASEVSGVKPLILSNPGIGKSTTVEAFAKVRGYEVVLLRGNSTSPEEVMGYDVPPSKVVLGESTGLAHLRPSWFQKLMEYHEQGKKVLLFLDELTTATEFVQAALLHLIFERKVHDEYLPEDTLIVAAGNYAGNLSTTMMLLPPTMNRFMIYNVAGDKDDLDVFLNKYEGAITSPTGECNNYLANLADLLKKMDEQEREVSEGTRNKIGEYIERSIKDTTKMLISTTHEIDLTVSDLRNIYSDSEDEDKVYGFVTFRTLCYLRDVAVAWYLCFGKSGINSKNFRNVVDGLCGIGVVRKGSDTKITKIGKNYFDQLVQVANELDKLDNNRLPEYVKFFVDITKGNEALDIATLVALTNKLNEMTRDKEVSELDRPLDEDIIKNLCSSMEKTVAESGKMKIDIKSKKLTAPEDVTKFTASVNLYNHVSDMLDAVRVMVEDANRNYYESTTKIVATSKSKIDNVGYKLRAVLKLMESDSPGISSVVPRIKGATKDSTDA